MEFKRGDIVYIRACVTAAREEIQILRDAWGDKKGQRFADLERRLLRAAHLLEKTEEKHCET